MGSSTRLRLFVLDPVRSRRDELTEGLRLRFDIQSFGILEDALVAARQSPPHAVLISLRQADGNGLQAATKLRELAGKQAILVVVGALEKAVQGEQRAQLLAKHGVDHWVTRAVDAAAIEVLLSSETRRRFPPPPAPPLVEEPSSARGSLGSRIKAILQTPLFGTGAAPGQRAAS